MKIYATIFLIFLTLLSCKEVNNEGDNAFAKAGTENIDVQDTYVSYGEKISLDGAMTKNEISERYAALAEGDTTVVKFEAPINDVCASKGCWMRLGIADEQQVFVKFKDYGFFVPTDTKDVNAVVEGKAYLEEVSVDELRHMAEDAGKSKEEIAAITKPERELRFMADGVLIKAD